MSEPSKEAKEADKVQEKEFHALRARNKRLEKALRNVLDEASLQAHFKGCDSRLDPARFERANSLVVCPACAAEALLSESER